MCCADEAIACFKNGLCCSQAILCAYGKRFGLDHGLAVRLSAGFGGGMGRTAGACGAVTGAYMVLGLKSDAAAAGKGESRARIYQAVRDFADRFKARNGSVNCRDLLRCDIGTPEGLATANEKGLFTTICPKVVRDAGEILEDMLGD